MRDEMIQEMISAYVDDELSSVDRALVEQWIEEEPRHRQYHDRLQRLRDHVRQSCRVGQLDDQLGRNLRNNVLARIEGSAPWETGNDAGPSVATASADLSPTAESMVAATDTLGRPSQQSSFVVRAAMAVMGVAAAVALIIYVGNPGEQDVIVQQQDPVGPVQPQREPPVVDVPPTEFVSARPASFLVLDVELTKKGLERDSVIAALDQAGLGVLNAVPVDATLEDALMSSRYFGENTPGAPKRKEAAPPVMGMTYVVVNGPRLDAVFAYLKEERSAGAVKSMLFDIAFMEGDTSLFKMLHSAAEYQIASTDPPAGTDDSLRLRAQRLVLTAALQTKLGRGIRMAVPAAGLMSGFLRGSDNDAASQDNEGDGDQVAPQDTPQAQQPPKPTAEQVREMASKTVGLLIVVRTVEGDE